MPKTIKITEQQFRRIFGDTIEVQNASHSADADGIMIQYWEEKMGITLEGKNYRCPKCGKEFSRKKLDGAHVVFPGGGEATQYITPLCQGCNRGQGDEIFKVDIGDIVIAPNQ